MTATDQAAAVEAIDREAWRLALPDRRPIWEWAEAHVGAIPYSPAPGPFRLANSPWLRGPLEAMADPRVRTVCIMAAVQAGKTMAGELALCHVIVNAPGPTLWLGETDDAAKDQSDSRLQRLFAECPPVGALTHPDRHKRTSRSIRFSNGMQLWVLGAHNKGNLQRRSIRWIFGDECWLWPPGHLAEAEARVTAFGWLGKCIWMSQGGVEGDDFSQKFDQTDRAEWTWTCPECGHRQPFKWSSIEWSKDAQGEDGEWDYGRVRETIALRCEGCNVHLIDTDEVRRTLGDTGAFVPQNPTAPRESRGFHWNALATMSWGVLAEMYLRAKRAARSGDIVPLRQFYQKRLAEPWREMSDGDFSVTALAPSQYCMGERWEDEGTFLVDGSVRARLRFLTVDVQLDHFWAVVRSWSDKGSSRLLWCGRLATWEDVAETRKRFNVAPRLVLVDAAFRNAEVCARCAAGGWTAMVGDPRGSFCLRFQDGSTKYRLYSKVEKVVVGSGPECRLHRFSSTGIKDVLARLRRNQDPARGPTWEIPADVPAEYLIHMDSERRVQRGRMWVWEKIGRRPNHLADCETLQMAGAVMLKLIGREAVPPDEPTKAEAQGGGVVVEP